MTGLGLDCRYCHASVDRSAIAGVPPTHTCMTCHSQLFTQAAMLAPVRESLAENKPMRWQRVNVLPDYVYFDHSIHIAEGVRVHDLSRSGRGDAADEAGAIAHHGMVSQLPSRSGAIPARSQPKCLIRTGRLPPTSWEEGRKRLVAYHIETQHLTDCSRVSSMRQLGSGQVVRMVAARR